jgi:hypothetical protein
MKVIINADPEDFDEAVRIIRQETPRYVEGRYNRIGWGWSYSRSNYPDATFFVRRIKDGLSITANRSVRVAKAGDPAP